VKLETAILSGFRAGIIALRSDGTVDYVNPIGSRILSTTPIAIGDNIHDKSGANQFFRLLSEALSLNYLPTRLETELPGKNGDRQVLGFTLAELRDEGAKLGICAFFKDLTHVEMAQENENLKSRLQVLGQMAASLAHEIRNPITSIGVHCGNLRSQLEENPRSLRILSAIANDVSRVESIIHECLTFVRQDTPEIRETAVDALLGELVAKFRDLHPGVSFTLSVSGQVPFLAEVDPGILEPPGQRGGRLPGKRERRGRPRAHAAFFRPHEAGPVLRPIPAEPGRAPREGLLPDPGPGRRAGHVPRRARPDLHPVLHDQAAGDGDRPPDDPEDRPLPRRGDRPEERAGRGDRVRDPDPDEAATWLTGFSSSRTTPPCGSAS
jgi:hypothetical protein